LPAADRDFPIEVEINVALAGYDVAFRTEAEMRARIEKYTWRNLEHRRWLVIQCSQTKPEDLHPDYKLT
jgi:hypothetical protein